jgi:hypothetical protein
MEEDLTTNIPAGVNIQKEIVSIDEAAKDKNGIMMNMNMDNPANIANLETLTMRVVEFLEYINKDEMVKMETDDPSAFKMHIMDKFIDYFDTNSKVFSMLLNKEDREANVIKLINFFELLNDIKNGKKDMNTEWDRFKEEHNEQYIYPKFGGKDAFEKTIAKRAKRQANRKRN